MTDAFPDFHAMRETLERVPDEMVHDEALAILKLCTGKAGLALDEFLWVIESYERRRPRVHGITLSEGVQTTEAVG